MKRLADWATDEAPDSKQSSPKRQYDPSACADPAVVDTLDELECYEPQSEAALQPTPTQHGRQPLYGVDAKCNKRPYMEDSYQISYGPCSSTDTSLPGYTICSVFDGHGGAFVAEYCARNVAERFSDRVQSAQFAHASSSMAVAEALKGALGALNSELKQQREAQLCGTTATSCVLTSSHICIASCGDSRAVIAKAGQALQPIQDHSLHRADERERVVAAGGRIIWNNGFRVMGALGMSRALGDTLLQAYGVSAEPEVVAMERSGEDDFLLLATDGLWGTVTNEEAVDVAYRVLRLSRLSRAKALSIIPSVLTTLAIKRGSGDNVTVMCLDLVQPAASSTPANPAAEPVACAAAQQQQQQAQQREQHQAPALYSCSTPPPASLVPRCAVEAASAAAPATAGPVAISGRRSASSPLPLGLMAAAASFVAPAAASARTGFSRTVTTDIAPVPARCSQGPSSAAAAAAACPGVADGHAAAGAGPVRSGSCSAAAATSWPAPWAAMQPSASPFATSFATAAPQPAPWAGAACSWSPLGRAASCSAAAHQSSSSDAAQQRCWPPAAPPPSVCLDAPHPAATAAAVLPAEDKGVQQQLPAAEVATSGRQLELAGPLGSEAAAALVPVAAGCGAGAPWYAMGSSVLPRVPGQPAVLHSNSSRPGLSDAGTAGPSFIRARTGSNSSSSVAANTHQQQQQQPLLPRANSGNPSTTMPKAASGSVAGTHVALSGFSLVSAGSSGALGSSPLRPSRSLGPVGLLSTARLAATRSGEVVGVVRRCSTDMLLGGAPSAGLGEAGRLRSCSSLPTDAASFKVATM